MLTQKQRSAMILIQERMDATGVAPSFDELSAALGCVKSSTSRLLSALEERGFIRRLPNRARAIDIIRRIEERPSARAFAFEDGRMVAVAALYKDGWQSA